MLCHLDQCYAYGFETIPLLSLLKMCPRVQTTLLALKLKENPR